MYSESDEFKQDAEVDPARRLLKNTQIQGARNLEE
jgi:hypothetical protein